MEYSQSQSVQYTIIFNPQNGNNPSSSSATQNSSNSGIKPGGIVYKTNSFTFTPPQSTTNTFSMQYTNPSNTNSTNNNNSSNLSLQESWTTTEYNKPVFASESPSPNSASTSLHQNNVQQAHPMPSGGAISNIHNTGHPQPNNNAQQAGSLPSSGAAVFNITIQNNNMYNTSQSQQQPSMHQNPQFAQNNNNYNNSQQTSPMPSGGTVSNNSNMYNSSQPQQPSSMQHNAPYAPVTNSMLSYGSGPNNTQQRNNNNMYNANQPSSSMHHNAPYVPSSNTHPNNSNMYNTNNSLPQQPPSMNHTQSYHAPHSQGTHYQPLKSANTQQSGSNGQHRKHNTNLSLYDHNNYLNIATPSQVRPKKQTMSNYSNSQHNRTNTAPSRLKKHSLFPSQQKLPPLNPQHNRTRTNFNNNVIQQQRNPNLPHQDYPRPLHGQSMPAWQQNRGQNYNHRHNQSHGQLPPQNTYNNNNNQQQHGRPPQANHVQTSNHSRYQSDQSFASSFVPQTRIDRSPTKMSLYDIDEDEDEDEDNKKDEEHKTHEREPTAIISPQSRADLASRRQTHVEQECWFYKKSRHLQQWRKRWTLIRYHQHNQEYVLYTFKSPNKLTNPTETMTIDENTEIAFESNENASNSAKAMYGKYLFVLRNKTSKRVLEFRCTDYEVGVQWVNAINCIIHLCEMNNLVMQMPSYCEDTQLNDLLVYAYLHDINLWPNPYLRIARNIVSTILQYGQERKEHLQITPTYCLKHRVSTDQHSNHQHRIDCVDFSSGNTLSLTQIFDSVRDNAGYCFVKNKRLAQYIHQQNRLSVSPINDTFNLLYRCGGNTLSLSSSTTNHCEVIAFRYNPTKSDMDSGMLSSQHYYMPQLPAHITSTSVVCNNNILYVVGGIEGKTYNERTISSRIYALDLYNEYEHGFYWKELSTELQLKVPKYGHTAVFLTDEKLMVIAGSNALSSGNSGLGEESKTVELYPLNGSFYAAKNKETILLSPTNGSHLYGGVCKGVANDFAKVCVGSNYCVELYDANKDYWQFIGDETNYNHIYAQVWCDEVDKNVLYIASASNHVEWIDVRQGTKKWNVIQQRQSNAKSQQWTNNLLFV